MLIAAMNAERGTHACCSGKELEAAPPPSAIGGEATAIEREGLGDVQILGRDDEQRIDEIHGDVPVGLHEQLAGVADGVALPEVFPS